MKSDDASNIDDTDEAAWAAAQRDVVIEYLAREQCEHNGVSQEPRWFISPYVVVWAVRSRAHPDRVGWWAISGDLPTDYIPATVQSSTGDVLLSFSQQWRFAAARMSRGKQADGFVVGNPEKATALAPLLLKRAELLEQFGRQLNAVSDPGEG